MEKKDILEDLLALQNEFKDFNSQTQFKLFSNEEEEIIATLNNKEKEFDFKAIQEQVKNLKSAQETQALLEYCKLKEQESLNDMRRLGVDLSETLFQYQDNLKKVEDLPPRILEVENHVHSLQEQIQVIFISFYSFDFF